MKADAIVQFLKAVGVANANKTKRTGWVVSRCPLGPWAHESGQSSPEVFGVRVESGDPRCRCFACGFHGTASALLQRMIGLNKLKPRIAAQWGPALKLTDEAMADFDLDLDFPGVDELMAEPKGLHEFPEWWLEGFPLAIGVPEACGYLQTRSLPLSICCRLDIRWDPKEKRVCFPVRDFKNRLVGLHGRAVDAAQEPRYRMYQQAKKNNPVAWLGESWVDLDQPLVVVEGPFDLASVKRVYRNVASPLFATPSDAKIRRMSDCLEWVTLFDRGTGGDQGRERISAALGPDHVIHHLHPPQGRKDPGEMTVGELVGLLQPIVALNAVMA